ncbi:MAG TPA: hypothetical protein VJK04_03180 [Candidatus Paceibacterota bacterium]
MHQFFKEKLTLKNIVLLLLLALGFLVFGVFARYILENFFLQKSETEKISYPPLNIQVVIPQGANTSTQNIITPVEAVNKALAVPGFEERIRNQSTTEVQAITGKKGQIDYWSVKTTTGYITIKAEAPPH